MQKTRAILRSASSLPSATTTIALWMLRPIPTPPPLPTATHARALRRVAAAHPASASPRSRREPSQHALGLARRRGHRGRIHVVAAERERADLAGRDELVEASADGRRARPGRASRCAPAGPAAGRARGRGVNHDSSDGEPADLEHDVLGAAQVLGVAAERDPAIRAGAARQDGAHVLGHEARQRRGLGHAGIDGPRAQAVAVLEHDRAALAQAQQRLGVLAQRALHVGGVAARRPGVEPADVRGARSRSARSRASRSCAAVWSVTTSNATPSRDQPRRDLGDVGHEPDRAAARRGRRAAPAPRRRTSVTTSTQPASRRRSARAGIDLDDRARARPGW